MSNPSLCTPINLVSRHCSPMEGTIWIRGWSCPQHNSGWSVKRNQAEVWLHDITEDGKHASHHKWEVLMSYQHCCMSLADRTVLRSTGEIGYCVLGLPVAWSSLSKDFGFIPFARKILRDKIESSNCPPNF